MNLPIQLNALIVAFVLLGPFIFLPFTFLTSLVMVLGVLIIFILLLFETKKESIKSSFKTAVWVAVCTEVFLQGGFFLASLTTNIRGQEMPDLGTGLVARILLIFSLSMGFLTYFSKRILYSRYPGFIFLFLLIFFPILIGFMGFMLAGILVELPSPAGLAFFYFFGIIGVLLSPPIAYMFYNKIISLRENGREEEKKEIKKRPLTWEELSKK